MNQFKNKFKLKCVFSLAIGVLTSQLGAAPALAQVTMSATKAVFVPAASKALSAAPLNAGTIPGPNSLQNLTPSGPITLLSNMTYSGLRISNPYGPCFHGEWVSNVRITNSEIGPCGGDSTGPKNGIEVFDSSSVRVDHSVIHDVSRGFYSVRGKGGIVFDHNYIYNIRAADHGGQITQYDQNSGAGNKILCNIGANTESDSTEDNVNLWMSKGTPESPLEVAYNRIRGGNSKTGSGIILGDGNGSANIDVHDNTIVNVNNVGISVAGGINMKIRNNRIFNNGNFTSVGLSVRNFYEVCRDVEVSNNRVWAFDRIWNVPPKEWHYLNTGECSNVNESGNVFGDTSLSPGIFDQAYPQCNE